MCLILFAFKNYPNARLILAANRDEFFDRPTSQAAFWNDVPQILAGRDLQHGGTWLGITRTGRFAAVTNYRDPKAPKGSRSRGNLVSDFLQSSLSTNEYLEVVSREAGNYSGFSLLLGEFYGEEPNLFYYSNRSEQVRKLSGGIYGMSNQFLDTPWKKVRLGKRLFKESFSPKGVDREKIFGILSDRNYADDAELPDTGVGLERERILSPIFIETEIYGTRSQTVLTIDESGHVSFIEKTTQPTNVGRVDPEVSFEFNIEAGVRG